MKRLHANRRRAGSGVAPDRGCHRGLWHPSAMKRGYRAQETRVFLVNYHLIRRPKRRRKVLEIIRATASRWRGRPWRLTSCLTASICWHRRPRHGRRTGSLPGVRARPRASCARRSPSFVGHPRAAPAASLSLLPAMSPPTPSGGRLTPNPPATHERVGLQAAAFARARGAAARDGREPQARDRLHQARRNAGRCPPARDSAAAQPDPATAQARPLPGASRRAAPPPARLRRLRSPHQRRSDPGYPRVRGKGRRDRCASRRWGNGVKPDGGRLIRSRIGALRLRSDRPREGAPKPCAIARNADGRRARIAGDVAPEPVPPTGTAAGADVGTERIATRSAGTRIPNPRLYWAAERKLRRAQRGGRVGARGATAAARPVSGW